MREESFIIPLLHFNNSLEIPSCSGKKEIAWQLNTYTLILHKVVQKRPLLKAIFLIFIPISDVMVFMEYT